MIEDLFSPDSLILASAFPFVKIERKLGEGGQKVVYVAKNEQLGTVAFKVIKSNQQLERIIREVSAASLFSYPRFPNIYDYGNRKVGEMEVVYIIEEFIEGMSLRERLDQGMMPEHEALRIGIALIEALCEISEKRLVHRDVKPENILLGNNNRVVLLDFGIARHLELSSLTHDVALFGPLTPGYAAPEQIKNEKRSISPRTDLFAWGVLMYEMLSGKHPFIDGCNTSGEALTRTININPPRLENCNSKLADIIEHCMRKTVHRRPITPKLVLQLLGEVKL